MPELPEVETTARALMPLLEGQTLTAITTSGKALRQPVPNLKSLIGHRITHIHRRSKYILLDIDTNQTLIIHLGMSGRLTTKPGTKHDHLILATTHGKVYFNDPRRFGLILLAPTTTLASHPLLKDLGPEPLDLSSLRAQRGNLFTHIPDFTPTYLYKATRGRTQALKPALMDAHLVVGVGNIYANESLFRARLNPRMPAGKLTRAQAKALVPHIRQTLLDAIGAGGSSLRDYAHGDGQLGNFQSNFAVYGRKGQPCPVCGTPIIQFTLGQRSTFACPKCQK